MIFDIFYLRKCNYIKIYTYYPGRHYLKQKYLTLTYYSS